MSAPEGCDSKLFDTSTAERRSIKKTLRDARLGKTSGGDQSAAKNSVTTVLTKDNILDKYSVVDRSHLNIERLNITSSSSSSLTQSTHGQTILVTFSMKMS